MRELLTLRGKGVSVHVRIFGRLTEQFSADGKVMINLGTKERLLGMIV